MSLNVISTACKPAFPFLPPSFYARTRYGTLYYLKIVFLFQVYMFNVGSITSEHGIEPLQAADISSSMVKLSDHTKVNHCLSPSLHVYHYGCLLVGMKESLDLQQ